ncbi:MAG: hypothetical protein KJP05_10075 [Deltaproteobacteria bacterium]|nr:hypothetical protein [Deltaproteobacteria bacterium]
MALYGIYGSHTTESCPLNNREVAERVVAVAESDVQSTASKYKISEIVGQYHSALEHTFLWIVEAEDPHLIEQFCVETGIASFNRLKIVPLITFSEGVIPLVKKVQGL